LKEEALDRTLWRTPFGRGCGPVVKQTMLRTCKRGQFCSFHSCYCKYGAMCGYRVSLLSRHGM